MPRFLRLKNNMVHVPSLSSVTMSSGCFGRPHLSLFYHIHKHVQKINYAEWEVCERDFNRVKKAMNEIEVMLNPVPLTEEPAPTSSVAPEPVKVSDVETKEQNTVSN
jgi:hypothetical protein